MKITLYERPIDQDVWNWARLRASRKRITLSRFIVDSLREQRDREQVERTGDDQ